MSEDIFRKKSLDKVRSPESLNDYVRVSNPAVWLLLTAVVVLLIGACIWGIFGHIESVINVDAYVENGEAVCFVSDADIERVKTGTPVRIDDFEGTVAAIEAADGERGIYSVIIKTELPDGTYSAGIITESISPMSFVIN